MNKVKVAAIVAVAAVAIFFYLSWLALDGFLFDIMSGKYYIVAVGVGYSMYPYIKNNDLLLVDVEDRNFSFGDVVVYIHGKDIIGHRVVEYKELENCYIVKGDNNEAPDPWCVSDREILGKVVKVIDNELLKYVAKIWLGEWT